MVNTHPRPHRRPCPSSGTATRYDWWHLSVRPAGAPMNVVAAFPPRGPRRLWIAHRVIRGRLDPARGPGPTYDGPCPKHRRAGHVRDRPNAPAWPRQRGPTGGNRGRASTGTTPEQAALKSDDVDPPRRRRRSGNRSRANRPPCTGRYLPVRRATRPRYALFHHFGAKRCPPDLTGSRVSAAFPMEQGISDLAHAGAWPSGSCCYPRECLGRVAAPARKPRHAGPAAALLAGPPPSALYAPWLRGFAAVGERPGPRSGPSLPAESFLIPRLALAPPARGGRRARASLHQPRHVLASREAVADYLTAIIGHCPAAPVGDSGTLASPRREGCIGR